MSFPSFNFENNPEWMKYKNNLLSDNIDLSAEQILKLQKKWYKKNIDPNFDIEKEENPRPQTSPSSSASPPPSYTSNNNTTRPNSTSSQSNINPTQKILYYCNITVVISYLIFCLSFILRFSQSIFFLE